MFVHEDPEWAALLSIIADATGRQVSFVEKDYWVTHALWALHIQGFDVWFRGGTSLSKGFGLIERFSEDLDLRVDAGSVGGLTTPVLPWDDSNKKRRQSWGPIRRFAPLGWRSCTPCFTKRRSPPERGRSCSLSLGAHGSCRLWNARSPLGSTIIWSRQASSRTMSTIGRGLSDACTPW